LLEILPAPADWHFELHFQLTGNAFSFSGGLIPLAVESGSRSLN